MFAAEFMVSEIFAPRPSVKSPEYLTVGAICPINPQSNLYSAPTFTPCGVASWKLPAASFLPYWMFAIMYSPQRVKLSSVILK